MGRGKLDLSNYDERISTMTNNFKLNIPNSKLQNEGGVALIAVLWFFTLLFVVAFGFTASVREEGMASYRYANEAEGYYLAVAGFERGLYAPNNFKNVIYVHGSTRFDNTPLNF